MTDYWVAGIIGGLFGAGLAVAAFIAWTAIRR